MLRFMLYGILMWATTVYAFRRGGWEEKFVSGSLLISSYLTPMLMRPNGKHFHGVESAVLWIDLAQFLLIVPVLFMSRKFWPMWVGAMAAMVILAHLVPYMPLPPRAMPLVYFRAEALWSWPMWILIAIGVRQHAGERLTAG